MEQFVLDLFANYKDFALCISIFISVIVSIAGVLPSVFVTAANITFFGFAEGIFVSLVGEALGAIISFFIYRKGIHKVNIHSTNKAIIRLKSAKGFEGFMLILALRLFPFVPSGLVTLAGAGSKISLLNYSIASTLGKVPALFIEAYAVMHVLKLQWQIQIGLAVVAILVIVVLFFRKKK
ncbi:TVP38/TMEM64 family protein [Bacillus massiliigorillae]|uniref:TVP38/TMEM64 family protein n=1 Tax=Bacillus massiliigorillae TaxID=1243664 RepID=UPI00039BE056|nr:VTT domain-containing protein [Bacillus massiliigorillae]